MATPGPTLNKPLVGIAAVGCLTAAAVMRWLAPEGVIYPALWRVGLMLSAFWFALPKKDEPITWGRFGPVLFSAVLVIVLLGRGARVLVTLLPLAIGLAIAAYVLRPKSKRR